MPKEGLAYTPFALYHEQLVASVRDEMLRGGLDFAPEAGLVSPLITHLADLNYSPVLFSERDTTLS